MHRTLFLINSSPTLCPQRLSLRTSPGTSLPVDVLLGHCLRGFRLGQLLAACGRAFSAAMRWCFRRPRTRGKYGRIRAAVHCVRLLANRTVHTARTRWTSLQSRCCIHPAKDRIIVVCSCVYNTVCWVVMWQIIASLSGIKCKLYHFHTRKTGIFYKLQYRRCQESKILHNDI